MTENGPRTGAPRDVPPPRPVTPATAVPVEDTGLGRAARALAEAVAGLVGGMQTPAGAGPAPGDGGPRTAATGLGDVIGAVAGAVGAAFGPPRGTGAPPPSGRAGSAAPSGDRTPGALLGDLLAAAAPRLPIRDGERLRAAYPGASDAEIADLLVARAARMTGGIGAATGGLSAAHWLAPPSLLALPLELGAETVLTAAVEVVLIGELHELHGRPAEGDARERAAAYLASWSTQRSVDGTGAAGLSSLLGNAGIRALRRRVTRRLAGNVSSAAPLLIGAALANRSNRRATEALAQQVLADLRGSGPGGPGGVHPRR